MKVLFVCTGNSCRSQMAEGLARAAGLVAESAGTEPAGFVHPLAIRAMAEIGIDISGQQSKPLDLARARNVDLVVTVCGGAEESCPLIPGVRRIHWPIPDPAKATGTPERILEQFRGARDDLSRRIQELLEKGKNHPD